MSNGAIFRKALRDSVPSVPILFSAIIVFETLLVWAIESFSREIAGIWAARPALQRFARLFMGAEMGAEIGPAALLTIGFVHPILLVCVFGAAIAALTRVTVAEIERGTAELLLTLPVSRGAAYAGGTLGGALAGLPLCAAPLAGLWLGIRIRPLSETVALERFVPLAVNFAALYLAVCGLAALLGAIARRRGVAIGGVLAILLVSLLLNLLSQFWDAIAPLTYLGLLRYYRALPIVGGGAGPWRDCLVLLGVGASAWCAGLWHFSRRDIPAV
ncbi:MAG: hypothetical protein CHACPFDD_01650 [Phycisphaerae bacterium]|nr:hypothetical protein [Phycisphaerae bacterium]